MNGHSHDHGADQATGSEVRWTPEFWDERYGSKSALWSGRVNAAVATEAAQVPLGRALDVGCGEGGDALWLAAQGWEVVGTDVSQVALDRAAAAAAEQGLADRATWEQHDALDWTPPPASYDLVSLAFFQLPAEDRRRVYPRLADAVAVGGSLVVVAHDLSDLEIMPRPHEPELFFTAADVVADLPGRSGSWRVHVAESRARTQAYPETGEPVTVHDTVLRAERVTR